MSRWNSTCNGKMGGRDGHFYWSRAILATLFPPNPENLTRSQILPFFLRESRKSEIVETILFESERINLFIKHYFVWAELSESKM